MTLKLTARQGELLSELSKGSSNREIGTRMGITEGTVRQMLHRLYSRAGTSNRTVLAMYAKCSACSLKR